MTVAPLPATSPRRKNYEDALSAMLKMPVNVRRDYHQEAFDIFTRVILCQNPWAERMIAADAVRQLTMDAAVYGDVFVTLNEYASCAGGGTSWRLHAASIMYRIETVQGKVKEFQSSATGPCYECVAVGYAEQPNTPLPCAHANCCLRYTAASVVHIRPHRRVCHWHDNTCQTLSPYGQSSLLLGHTAPSPEFVLEVESGIRDLCHFLKTGERIPTQED